MRNRFRTSEIEVVHHKFNYGWIVVASCTLLIAITYGEMYSYSVFFKPLADYFSWDRATVSLIYSAALIIRGAASIGVGWLADRYGPIKISIFCGFMIGLGLVLSSRTQTLWQFFLTYAVVEAIGFSGAFGIGTAMVSRWFTKNRGLALGIVSLCSGLGTLLVVPGNERLVNIFTWSQAFLISGTAAGVIMIAAALFLRSAPPSRPVNNQDLAAGIQVAPGTTDRWPEMTITRAIRDIRMILLLGAFLLFFFCTQIVMVHLVNYATDMGISSLVAATLLSIIGAVSIAGRLTTGIGSDKIGVNNILILTRVFLVIAFVCLIFTRSLWTFYLFAVIFGFTYGAEVPQIPLFISKFFGTKAMATLVGLALFIGNIGGALGSWVAGKIFDATQSYDRAFMTGAMAAVISLGLAWLLKRQSQRSLE